MASIFKLAGIRVRCLEEVVLSLDEFEALRLADFEGLYQEETALRMEVSRPTFGRIIDIARRKVAEALDCGRALRIDAGSGRSGRWPPTSPPYTTRREAVRFEPSPAELKRWGESWVNRVVAGFRSHSGRSV